MTITPKRIDNLCKWHRKNGGWALQLECTRHFLFCMTLSDKTTPETCDRLNNLMMQIDITLAEVKAYPPKEKRKKATA